MAKLNEDGQWIIMMSLIICTVLMFLAIIVNESVLVGKTTAESVLEFSKSDIQDMKDEVTRIHDIYCSSGSCDVVDSEEDLKRLSIERKSILLDVKISQFETRLHFNNGVNQYDDTRIYEK
jgi:hypothetical protein